MRTLFCRLTVQSEAGLEDEDTANHVPCLKRIFDKYARALLARSLLARALLARALLARALLARALLAQ